MFSGGAANPLAPWINQAREAGSIYRGLGINPNRLILEDKSLNTYDSLVRARALAEKVPGQNWVLVTSAIHMPRTMAVADQIGWRVTPFVSDYMSQVSGRPPPPSTNTAQKLNLSAKVIHEYVGLLFYWMSGKL